MKLNKLNIIFIPAFFFINFSYQEIQCTENPDEVNLMEEYTLTRNFVDLSDCQKLVEVAGKMIETFYTEDNIQRHIAFPVRMANNRGRDYYAFVIHHSNGESDSRLPGLKFDNLDPVIQQVSKLVESKLEIEKGRYILNFQRYYQGGASLPLHFDHEVYSFERDSDGTNSIKEAIVPNKVAVLTLINNAVIGGTRLSTKDKTKSIVVEYDPSDLLVFNNTRILHGTDAFIEKPDFKPPYVRYIMGWRALDYNCHYFNVKDGSSMKALTYEEVIEKNNNFMRNDWQELLNYWRS